MKVLITGMTGMLGTAVYHKLKSCGHDVIGIARKPHLLIPDKDLILGDITDYKFVQEIKNIKPNVVIHTAANVNVNSCENDKNSAYLIHVKASEYIAKVFCNTKLFYISTDSIFSGDEGLYKETSIIAPSNYYALTKLQGENVIIEESKNIYILRLNLYGFHTPLGNSLFEWAHKNLVENKKINGFTNVLFNPLYCGQIANLIIEFLEHEIPFGIYHLSSDNSISKYHFLVKMAKFFNLDTTLINPVKADVMSMGTKRPLNTTLDNTKVKNYLPNYDFSLDQGLIQLYKEFPLIKK